MKKFLKTLAKKSLSLIMACLMLLTCWVFVAPEASAATTAKYSFTLTYNLGEGESGGNIKVYYYNFKDDGSGVDTSSTGSEQVVNGYGDLTVGDGKSITHNCTGFPYKIEVKDESASCDDRAIKITGFSINGVSVDVKGGFEVSNRTSWIQYDGQKEGMNTGIPWALPTVNSISLSPTSTTAKVPVSGTGSAKITATVKDQYGYQYHKLTTSNCTMNPQVTGISTSVSNNVITVSGTEAVFANHSGYSSTTGTATSTLSVLMGNSGSKTASVTFQSSDYTVNFTGCGCGQTHTVTCKYNGKINAPNACTKTVPNDKHYAFDKWALPNDVNVTLAQGAELSGIKTTGTTYKANYFEGPHIFDGAWVDNEDQDVANGKIGTHSKACTGVITLADGTTIQAPCALVGLNGHVQGTTGGQATCAPEAWGGDNNLHTGICKECEKDLKHTPQSVKVVDEKYRISDADCNNPAVYYESCSLCGQAITSYTFTDGKAKGHNWVVDPNRHVDSTCNDPGYDVLVCERCGEVNNEYVYNDSEGNLLYPAAHKWNQGLPKDRGDGYHGYYCTVETCGVWDSTKTEKHNYNQGGWAKIADCENNGVAKFTCNGCRTATTTSEYVFDTSTREFTTELIAPALDHKNEDGTSAYKFYEAGVKATCTTEGYHKEKCSLCSDIKTVTDPINLDAHKPSAARPNDDDTHTIECEYCHDQVTESCKDFDDNKDCICDVCNDPIAHDYQNIVSADKLVSAADCNSYAVYYKSCSVCGTASDETFEDVDAGYGEHNWSETTKFNKSVAKCETDAVYYYECLECDMSSEAFDGRTWTDEGTGYAHVFNGAIVKNNDGTHSYTCSNVDADGVACTEIGGKVDCTYGEWDKENANGHTHTCPDCGYTTPVEAHNWGEGWKPAADNTDSAAGQMIRTCTVCSRTETTNCQYGEGVVFEANCMHNKYTEYTCSDCGHGYTVIEEGTKLDHSYTGKYDIDAENDKHRQLCVNGCNEYGEWAACTLKYSQITGTETHTATCPACGNVDTGACSGGSATCIKKAECDKCGGEHGDYAPHAFSGAAVNRGEGKHNYNCSTPGCTEYGVGSVIGATEDCFGGTAYCDAKKVCEACNTAYGEIDPNNHRNTTAMPGLDPTCMAEGYTAYEQCDNPACNAELGKETIPVDPDAHKWNTEAHSTNDGKHYYACEYNAEHKDYYDCFCSNPSILPPTCLEGGYTEHYCDDCNYYWTTDPTEPTDHDWGEWTTDENKTGHYRVCKNDEKHIETGVCAESATSVVTAPTCTEQGFTTYTCDLCGNVWVADYVPATGHTYTQKIIDDAHLFTADDYTLTGVTTNTCERADYYWFDCKDCDKNGKDETDTDKYPLVSRYYQNGKGEGHTWNGKSVSEYAILATPATCDKNATYYVYCTACHMTSKDIEGVEETFEAWGTAISHDYQEIVDQNDLTKNRVSVATCTAKAKYYKSCANCGDVSEDTFNYGEMTAHKYTKKMSDYAHIITEATCETVATYWYNCEYCNSNAKMIEKDGMTEEEIAALQYTDGTLNPNNHGTLIRVPYKAPTCKEDGHSEYRVCSLCDKEIGKVTAGYEKKNHSFKGEYKIVNVVDADGNVTAYKHQRACEYGCGEYSTAADCGFSAWTQNADGKTHSMACVCGNKITANCEADSNASCEVAATCKDCKGVVGTVSGHDWGNWTSNGDGKTHSRVCKTNSKHVETDVCGGGVASGCGAIYCSTCNQQYATGVDHDWGEWVDTKAATCLTPAEHMRACQKCSATEEETYGTALGHDYDKDNDGINDYVVTKEATCTEAGIKTFTCLNNCGETYTEVIKALGHELAKEWTTVQEATCAAEGKQIKKCVHSWKDADGKTVECDYYEEKTIPADKSKHVPGEWIPDEGASNCVTGLKSYKYCTVCGLEVDSKTETISHDWKADGIVYGTCTANGYINMLCSKCGSRQVFDEKTPGFPNKFDDTVIDGATASKLLSKGGHKWETSTSSSADYVIQNGCVIYVTKAATCSKLGTGYMVCSADGCKETKTVSINKTEHNLKTMPASEATCQTPGHTEYLACRNCSYAEKPTTIPKLGHVDKDGSGKCDRCGFQMYAPPSGGTAACGCMCHNSSFFMAKIIYPIARFFWKLFKTNKSCSCGNVHY